MTFVAWGSAPLEELCRFRTGLWRGKKGPLQTAGVIRNTNFGADGKLDDSDIAYLEVETAALKDRRLRPGDIIVEKSGGGPKQPVGRVCLFELDGRNYSFSNFTFALTVQDIDRVSARFLHKFLFWFYESGRTEEMQSHSTGIRNLDGTAYKQIKVPVPPLAEQHRIVAVLDEAFEAIATATANAEKNLENIEELRRGSAKTLLSTDDEGWLSEPLGELCELYQPQTISRAEMIEEGPFPVFGANGYIGQYHSFNHEDSQLLVTCRGATCGSINISLPRSWITGNSMVVRPRTDKLSTRYLRLVLENAFDFTLVITGSAQPQITRQSLAPAVICFPGDRQSQDSICDALERLEVEISTMRKSCSKQIAALAELKQSLLAHAFSGELTASDVLAA